MRSTSTWIRVLAAGSAAVIALAVAGCSSKADAQNNSQAGGGANATGKRYTVAMITHEVPGDTFWDKVRNGAQEAARQLNIDLR